MHVHVHHKMPPFFLFKFTFSLLIIQLQLRNIIYYEWLLLSTFVISKKKIKILK